MKDKVFIIVLYNKKCSESITLKNLVMCSLNVDSICIVWNNGPQSIKVDAKEFFSKTNIDYNLIETVENISLAKIYNRVMIQYEAKRYIILDDDSKISSHYFTALDSIAVNDVGMPVIYSNGVIVNPRINNIEYKPNQKIKDDDVITTIGSGLVIGENVALSLREKFSDVFDERFNLYGVDTSFCYRLKHVYNANIKIISGFEHNLSRLNSCSDTLKVFRREERSNDVALQIRYYLSRKKWIPMLTMIMLSSLKKAITNKPQQYNLITVLKVFIKGKHERL